MVARTDMTASGAFSAISAASAMAASRSCSPGTSLSISSDGQRFFAGYAAAGIQHGGSLLLSDDPGQGNGDAEALMDAELDEICAEACRRAGHAEVGYQCEPETAAMAAP